MFYYENKWKLSPTLFQHKNIYPNGFFKRIVYKTEKGEFLLKVNFLFCKQKRTKHKMLRNPAGERNVVPIIETLKNYIKNESQERKNFLEISSGKISLN